MISDHGHSFFFMVIHFCHQDPTSLFPPSLSRFSRQGLSVALESVLDLALVEQVGLGLTEILLPLISLNPLK